MDEDEGFFFVPSLYSVFNEGYYITSHEVQIQNNITDISIEDYLVLSRSYITLTKDKGKTL